MNIEMLKYQINRLTELLACPDVDVLWSSYDNPKQVINEIKSIENNILNGDIMSIVKMKFLLSPAGELQEISISSGWGDEFLEIAYAIETALGIQTD